MYYVVIELSLPRASQHFTQSGGSLAVSQEVRTCLLKTHLMFRVPSLITGIPRLRSFTRGIRPSLKLIQKIRNNLLSSEGFEKLCLLGCYAVWLL
jgi:hypothetical protein